MTRSGYCSGKMCIRDRYPLLSRMEAVAENFIDEVETLRDNDMEEEERAIVMEKFMNMYETCLLYTSRCV